MSAAKTVASVTRSCSVAAACKSFKRCNRSCDNDDDDNNDDNNDDNEDGPNTTTTTTATTTTNDADDDDDDDDGDDDDDNDAEPHALAPAGCGTPRQRWWRTDAAA